MADDFYTQRGQWRDQVLRDPELSPLAFKLAYVISDHVHQDTMYVENRFFQPPVYPGQPGGCQHHTLRP